MIQQIKPHGILSVLIWHEQYWSIVQDETYKKIILPDGCDWIHIRSLWTGDDDVEGVHAVRRRELCKDEDTADGR